VDYTWKRVAWALALHRLPGSVITVSVTPSSNVVGETAASKDVNTHVIAIWNRDYRDEQTILQTETELRSTTIGVRAGMTYKPDVFSACGVYRGNEWGLRPTLYASRYYSLEGKSSVESALDLEWKFVVRNQKAEEE